MLTLGLALVVLGLFGLVLRGVRRLRPGTLTRPRIVLLQLALVAAWVFLVGVNDNEAGLAAAVLVIALFTVYFTMQFALRPMERPR